MGVEVCPLKQKVVLQFGHGGEAVEDEQGARNMRAHHHLQFRHRRDADADFLPCELYPDGHWLSRNLYLIKMS
jgi:hypothetical protein